MKTVKSLVLAKGGSGNKWSEQRIFRALKNTLCDTIMMDA